MKVKSKLYKQDIIKNKKRYKTANTEYLLCAIELEDGVFTHCMLTSNALKQGIERAEKNKEDIRPVKYTVWERIKNVFR